MKRTALLLLLTTLACGGDTPVSVDGTCAVGVHLNDLFYLPLDRAVDEGEISAEPYFHIARYDPECYDQGETHRPVDGESNFLAEGTPLHRVEGFEPLERLAYYDEDAAGWRPLVPAKGCSGESAAATVDVEGPCSG